jgi:hypothetical protein
MSPPAEASRLTAGVAWGAAGVLCFSGTAPATRVAAPALGPETLTFARIVIAALLAAAVLSRKRDAPRPGRADLPSLAVMGLGLAIGFPLLLAVAVERVPAAHGAVVIGVVPAATAALSVLRTHERPPARFWLGCAAGLTAVLAFAAAEGGGSLQPADLWLLAAVASCAIGYVEGARQAQRTGADGALLGHAPSRAGRARGSGHLARRPFPRSCRRGRLGRTPVGRCHEHVPRVARLVSRVGDRRDRAHRPAQSVAAAARDHVVGADPA